jgi:ribonuclease D
MWIDQQEQLLELVASVDPGDLWIDTEYDNQRYFAPLLALVQVAWSDGSVVIDPLEVDLAALNGWGKRWFSHDGTHDWLLLDQANWRPPDACLDTQIAARLLGYERFGLASLVESVLGLELDKSEQRSDWLRRPLSAEQQAYAVGDVVHLRGLTAVFSAEIAARGLERAWLEESALVLERGLSLSERQPKPFWKVKDLRKQRPLVLGRAKTILDWRFAQAQERNQPEFRVLNDHLVVRLATGQIRPRERSLAQLLKASEPCDWPERKRPAPSSSSLEKKLKAWRIEQVAELPMETSMVLPSRCISQLAQGQSPSDIPELQGWRQAMFGDQINALIS